VEGNALVESATFIAILLGTIAGGIIIAFTGVAHILIGCSLLTVAVMGWLTSRHIPSAPAADPQLTIDWNTFAQIKHVLTHTYANKTVFLAILGISWFWFYGAVILTEIPNYTRLYLGGSEAMVTVLFATFSIGISLGSLLCNHFSKLRLELGLVPFGSIGLSIFAFTLYGFSPETIAQHDVSPLVLLQTAGTWGVVLSAFILGVFGGLYSVPLYVIMQQQSDVRFRSRVIAANNILNSVFVVLSAIFGICLIKLGLSIPQLFFALGVVNILVSAYIYKKLPLFLIRLVAWLIVSVFFNIKVVNREHIPEKGAAIIVCNHVSYMDALIIAAACRRFIYFVMDDQIFKHPLLNFLFRRVGTIPIASEKRNIAVKRAAFEQIGQRLSEGELIGVFPEGILTHTGEINLFRRGIEQAIKHSPVPIIPIAIQGLWGSYFSRDRKHYLRRLFQQIHRPITVVIGAPVPPKDVSAAYLQTVVTGLYHT
jgi:1-acyl-sn-glycerol-3-phosphate acyltransferase